MFRRAFRNVHYYFKPVSLSGDIRMLEGLRCKNGCDPRFLSYLTWEGTDLRIISTEWDVGTSQHLYNMGLRCQDCFLSMGYKGIAIVVKEALDRVIDYYQNSVQDYVDELGGDHTKGEDYFQKWIELIEGNRGLE